MADNPKKRYRKKIREYDSYGIIYKATLIFDGRCYIGQTIRSLKERISEHFHKLSFYFNLAIKKYGLKSFLWQIIDYADSQEELDQKEISWISYYKSNIKGCGFNLTSGGDHPVFSAKTRIKMSKKMRGFKNHRYGKKASKETRTKMSESQKGKHINGINIKCVETGKIYKSIRDTCRNIGIGERHLPRLLKSGKKSKKYGLSFIKLGGDLSLI